MFARCLICSTPFEANEVLEHFPHGRRIAFDPARGRLWAICRSCKRWTLAPIEERWEALEELEKLTTDKARLLSQTENIALLRSGPLEIVRVGRANLTEEAWWRYGRQLLERRRSYRRISVGASVGVMTLLAGGIWGGMGWMGAWMLWEHAPEGVVKGARWLRFGSSAWRGRQVCAECGHVFDRVAFTERESLILAPGTGPQTLVLRQRCPRCRSVRGGGLALEGREAERTAQRLLAFHHFSGASEGRVRSAARLISEAGSPAHVKRLVLGAEGRRLGDLRRTGAIALEIAANEASEQRLLELELAELETHWREEEELADIIDGELTPLPAIESLRRRVAGWL
ncbi:MAG: hypothetical protein R3E98_11245 [Gemmatimonadota bacterium]|nr:hypothetical protein [Gemmatimonadota bacterium]